MQFVSNRHGMYSSELMLSFGASIRYSLLGALPGMLELQVPIAGFMEKYFGDETPSMCIMVMVV